MNIKDFFNKFALTIRCSLNWKLLVASRPKIVNYQCSLPSAADNIWTPWYTDDSGSPREFYHKDAMPISVMHAAANQKLLQYQKVKNVLSVHNTSFVFPGYKLPGLNILLLDGNHRSVSAMVEERRIAISLFVIEGSMDPSILPDLYHWQ